ncbi:hypothetical protein M0813_10709 [Anaeramoeba flamelloides]|uniref:Uncharacterized protein n=1 Tax=Anaeramoeba flamelloides TaxID=1746091 RepID=A0ABQ8X1U2_9EUKA|nr:hypothetical protein M0813_10709 [Anaeramoeba flamelloides]
MTEELEQQWYVQNKVSSLGFKLQNLLEDCLEYLNLAFNDFQDQTIDEKSEKKQKRNQTEIKTEFEQNQMLTSSSDDEETKQKTTKKENDEKEPKQDHKKEMSANKQEKKKQTQKKKKKKIKKKEIAKSVLQTIQTNVVILNLNKGRITGTMMINEFKIINADLKVLIINHKSRKKNIVNMSIMGEIPFILRQVQDTRQYIKLILIDLGVLTSQRQRKIGTVEKIDVILKVVKRILLRLNFAKNALEFNSYDVFPHSKNSDRYFQQLSLKNVDINAVIDILIENNCLLVRVHSFQYLTQGLAENITVGNSMIGKTLNYHNKLIEVTDEIESKFFLPNIKLFRNTLSEALELTRQLNENIEVLCSGF